MAASDSRSVRSASTASSPPSTSSSTPLVGQVDDPFVPTSADIRRAYHDGLETWQQFLDKASTLPPGLWPAGLLDPYVTLMDVPSLPAKLPRTRVLHGRPVWRVPDGVGDGNVKSVDGGDEP